MNNNSTYLLLYKYFNDETPCLTTEIVTEPELEDITALMKNHGLTAWTQERINNWEQWAIGQGKLVETRDVTVKPMKIVEAWSWQPERDSK